MTPRLVATVVVCLLVAAVGSGVLAAATQTDEIRASPETAAIGEEVTFSAPGIDADTYKWDFGDDTVTPTGSAVTHEYVDPGTYTVTLEASTDGETTTYETTVTVEPRFANVTQVEPGADIHQDSDGPHVEVYVYAIEVPPDNHFAVSADGGGGELRLYDTAGQQIFKGFI